MITIDNMPAHLAGAMGVPFRPKHAGNWRPVVAGMKNELHSSITREKTKPVSVGA